MPARLHAAESRADEMSVESLKQYVATVSHELRTPTTVIAGLAATLADRRARLTEEQLDQALQRLRSQSDRLVRLLTELLDLAAIEAGQLYVRLEPVPIGELAAAALAAAPMPRGVSVAVEIEGDPVALADANRLEQVLVNLLTNAARYGGTAVRIEARETLDGITVSVVDAGPGVPPEQVSDLFEPFSRGEHAREGSGLGLSIARGYLEAMDGRIWYERNEPSGARFSMRLQAAGEGGKGPEPRVGHEAAPGATRSPRRILVVDDEPDTLFLYKVILEAAGYEVVSAWNGQEALARLAESPVAAVITDLMMPVMDGRELIGRLRSDPRTAAIPVAAVSASPMTDTGADITLTKPFRPQQVLEALERLTEER